MIFLKTALPDVFEIHLDEKHDERGFFARTWCELEFRDHGLNPKVVQCSLSFNERAGTLRGLHYQAEPHSEDKLVRCTRGAIYDVVVDLRPGSLTFKKWIGRELTAVNHRSLYVPRGCGHGFITLQDHTEVLYQMSEFYFPELARGVRWNDPAFGIEWPGTAEVISERDRSYEDFESK
jgi:dTDP-4-dehydrorhamnose 3,5-epimerase